MSKKENAMPRQNGAGSCGERQHCRRFRHMGAQSGFGAQNGQGPCCMNYGKQFSCEDGTERLIQRKKALEGELSRVNELLSSR